MSELNKALAVINEVQKAVVGKNDVIEKIMAAIIAQGHILIEDMPGVGKTTMAKAFSKAMGIKRQSSTVHTGYNAVRFNGIFHIQKGNGTVCLQTGSTYVQYVFGR